MNVMERERKILDVLSQYPDATSIDIASEVGLSVDHVVKTIQLLVVEGVVIQERRGNTFHYRRSS